MEMDISIEDMSFIYSGRNKNGIKGINLRVKQGEMILITGRSGCGKTTLTRCINGMIPYFYYGKLDGNVSICGKKIDNIQIHDIAINVGSVFQDPRSQFFATTTTNELAFGMENIGTSRNEMICKINEIEQDLDLENLMDRSIFELSSGEKQKIAIGSVCVMEPSIIVFDEPSANIDGHATHELANKLGKLKAMGHTIIVVEHRLYYLKKYVDRIIYMDQGMIVEEMTNKQFSLLDKKSLNDRGLRIFDINELKGESEINTNKNPLSSSGKDPFLSVKNISYKNTDGKTVLKNVSLNFNQGETVGIIGKNGAGKTTLINVISGLLKETSGEIQVSGKKVSVNKRSSLIYMVMQDSDYQLFTESVEEEIKLGNEKQNGIEEKINEILSELNLDEFSKRHPASLSGGEKQRVVIGSAIARNSDIVIFDEPTSGLDFDNMNRISKLINNIENKRKSIIIVSHDIEFLIRTCKRIEVIDNGEITDSYRLDRDGLIKLHDFFCLE